MAINLKIALVGHGTASSLLAAALSAQGGAIDYEVFEAHPEDSFHEPDADMELGPSAVAALKAIGLDQRKLFVNAGAKDWVASRCLIAIGEHKGEAIIKPQGNACVVLKGKWRRELEKLVPEKKIHYGKKLVGVSGSGDGTRELRFEDGSTSRADVIVGCDGLRSAVRDLILSPQYPHLVAPRFTGYWDVFGRTTPSKAAALFGPDLLPFRDNEIALTGDGAAMLFRPTGDPEQYDVFMAGISGSLDEVANEKFSRSFLERTYADWDPAFVSAVASCVLNDSAAPLPIFPQFESQESPTYSRDRLVMIGDAAHRMGPWTGSNAEMEIEDVAVLAAVLRALGSPRGDVGAALWAFDQTRRGRAELLARRTHLVAKVMTGQLGLDPGRIRELAPERWWAEKHALDVGAQVREALAHFELGRGRK